jgi:hypothetical protein
MEHLAPCFEKRKQKRFALGLSTFDFETFDSLSHQLCRRVRQECRTSLGSRFSIFFPNNPSKITNHSFSPRSFATLAAWRQIFLKESAPRGRIALPGWTFGTKVPAYEESASSFSSPMTNDY